MTGKQTGILWMGILLIVVRGWASGLFSELWYTMALPGFGQTKSTTGSTSSSTPAAITGTGVISV